MLERRQRTGSGDIRRGREGGKSSDSHKISEAGCPNVSLSFGLSSVSLIASPSVLALPLSVTFNQGTKALSSLSLYQLLILETDPRLLFLGMIFPSFPLAKVLSRCSDRACDRGGLPLALNRNKITLFFIQRRPMKAEGQDETGKCSSVHSNYLKSQR